jgi:hypothetical protein
MTRGYILSKDWQSAYCFEEGLEFGNPAQIDFLKRWNRELAEEEGYEDEGKQKYRVIVEVTGSYAQDVWASDEDEAEEIVKKDFDMDYVDVEVLYGVDPNGY